MTKSVMMYTHPTCSTCKGVLKQLEQFDYTVELIDVRQTPPSKEFFETLLATGIPVKKMLNTSGQSYKELGLKDKIDAMSFAEIATLLSTNGMLVKRPVVIQEGVATFGTRDIDSIWGEK